ncbi:hypothetical protein GF377_04555, partial [candidate division GN15 bacterium]|nr:hypothetical protein [candidate division GN15 bacterium]
SSTASPNVPSRFAAEPAPVRIMLPEQFETSGKPLNQTLMLRIEPEHLGPARLNLHLRNEILTARVTVDTPLAKATVEQSLDQLTSQLARVGITVDRIEVAVGGNGARNEFLDRRPSWAQQIKTKEKYLDDEEDIEPVRPVMTPAAMHAGYIRESGVNVLA